MLLIDGTYLVYKSYYWAKKKTEKYEDTNLEVLKKTARNKFMRQIGELVKRYEVSSLFVLFDSEEENFREVAFDLYKKNRKKKPEDIIHIKKDIYRFLKKSGIDFQIAEGVEADDLIASFIQKNPHIPTYVYTGDSDLGAVVTETATLLQEKKNSIHEITLENFLLYFPVLPQKLADYKALAGDKSDNVPKIKYVTLDERMSMLKKYESVEDFFQNGQQDFLFKKIEKEKEKVLFNKFLVTLKTDCAVTLLHKGDIRQVKMSREDAIKMGWDEIIQKDA